MAAVDGFLIGWSVLFLFCWLLGMEHLFCWLLELGYYDTKVVLYLGEASEIANSSRSLST